MILGATLVHTLRHDSAHAEPDSKKTHMGNKFCSGLQWPLLLLVRLVLPSFRNLHKYLHDSRQQMSWTVYGLLSCVVYGERRFHAARETRFWDVQPVQRHFVGRSLSPALLRTDRSVARGIIASCGASSFQATLMDAAVSAS